MKRAAPRPQVSVLTGETLDIRMVVDRPVVEIFVNGGRAAYVAADGGVQAGRAAVALFNNGTAAVVATNVSAYSMGCGWTDTKPIPKASMLP